MHNRGIALLQVLLITAVISILALYFSSTAREQVKLAQLAAERGDAFLAMKTAQSRLFLALFTQFREPQIGGQNAISTRWNFYDAPFSLENEVIIRIQDQSGLVGIGFPDPKLMKNIFEQNGANGSLAPIITSSLLDWQDADRLTRANGAEQDSYSLGPRNGLISLKQEVSMVRGMSVSIWQNFNAIYTLYQRGAFNPMAAPPKVLAGLIGRDRTAEYLTQRTNIPITAAVFSSMTGIQESINQILYPSNMLGITLQAKQGEVLLTKKMMLELNPYAVGNQSPVDVLEVQW